MVITTYISTEDMINKLQSLQGKIKFNFSKSKSNSYNEMKRKNFQTQEDLFAKNARGESEIYHEVLLLMKLLQTKPKVKNMNINYYDLFYSVIRNRDDKNEILENNEKDYNNFNDLQIPNHYIGIKPRETLLK